jgi:hypothetical protein
LEHYSDYIFSRYFLYELVVKMAYLFFCAGEIILKIHTFLGASPTPLEHTHYDDPGLPAITFGLSHSARPPFRGLVAQERDGKFPLPFFAPV